MTRSSVSVALPAIRDAFGALVAGLGYKGGTAVSLVVAGALLFTTMLASLRLRGEEA